MFKDSVTAGRAQNCRCVSSSSLLHLTETQLPHLQNGEILPSVGFCEDRVHTDIKFLVQCLAPGKVSILLTLPPLVSLVSEEDFCTVGCPGLSALLSVPVDRAGHGAWHTPFSFLLPSASGEALLKASKTLINVEGQEMSLAAESLQE